MVFSSFKKAAFTFAAAAVFASAIGAQAVTKASAARTAGTASARTSEANDPAAAFYAATEAAPAKLKAGEIDEAARIASDLLQQSEEWKKNWNYGNAIHVANLVLGHAALSKGETDAAKSYLLKAAQTPGSPQLNSFGPNMLLAKLLLEKGEKAAVVEYLEQIKTFWSPKSSRADEWKAAVERGEMPDFGANLRYNGF